METARSAIARRMLGAVLLSLVAHTFLIASFKPASARYAGDPFLRVNLRAVSTVEAPPPGRSLRPPSPSKGPREPIAARRVLSEQPRAAKRYLGGKDARPGNLPDGRDAVELDMKILSQYYSAREVDERAVALEEPPLFNPPEGPPSGYTARVLLLVLINERGGVDSVATLESKYPGPYGTISRNAFAATRFAPALKGGRPVKSRQVIEITYGH